jgi:hypothetical protein
MYNGTRWRCKGKILHRAFLSTTFFAPSAKSRSRAVAGALSPEEAPYTIGPHPMPVWTIYSQNPIAAGCTPCIYLYNTTPSSEIRGHDSCDAGVEDTTSTASSNLY